MTDTETFYITHDPLTGFPVEPAPPIPMPLNRAKRIIDEVAAQYKIRAAEMIGPRRHAYLIEPRHVAMRRIRAELGYSYPQIGRLFNRDHSTIIWACRGGRKNQPSQAKQPQERAA
jgi:chromosomal replication initiation ATPase DnaA